MLRPDHQRRTVSVLDRKLASSRGCSSSRTTDNMVPGRGSNSHGEKTQGILRRYGRGNGISNLLILLQTRGIVCHPVHGCSPMSARRPIPSMPPPSSVIVSFSSPLNHLSVRAKPSLAAAQGALPGSTTSLAGNEPPCPRPTSPGHPRSLAGALPTAARSLAEGTRPVVCPKNV
jgi:hypothetical protein